MKQFFGYFLLLTLLAGCATPPPAPTATPRSLGGAVELPTAEPTRIPQLQLSATTGQPGDTIAVLGNDFPPNVSVDVQLATAANPNQTAVTVPAQVDELGNFAADLILPTTWVGVETAATVELLVQATSLTIPAQSAQAALTMDYTGAFSAYTSPDAGFTLDLPVDWVVEGPLLTPLGQMYLLGQAPLQPGDPAVSTFLVAPLRQWTAARAAEQLVCGGDCLGDVNFVRTTIGDLPARQLTIETEGVPTLTWYFVEEGETLFYFTLHDPLTFASLDGLVQTLVVDSAAVELALATPTPVPTPTNTPSPTPEPSPTPLPPTATPDLRELGPVQMINDLLTSLTRQEIFSTTDVPFRFTAAFLAESESAILLNVLQIDQVTKTFSVARENGVGGVVVRVEMVLLDDTRVARLFEMLKEDDVWRINSITPAPLPQPSPAVTPTP